MYTLNATGVHGVAQPIPLDLRNAGRDPEKHDEMNRQGVGVGQPGDPAHTVTTACVHGVAHTVGSLCARTRLSISSQDAANGHLIAAQPIAWDEELNASVDVAGTLLRGGQGGRHDGVAQPIAFTTEQTPKFNQDQALTLTKSEAKHNQSVLTEMAVRRLTPTECERLQGFPDGYTDIQPNGKQTPDGPRYKALGNSMAVPVMKWIGKRINQVEKL
jgi:DNA (cytosine-5)-methyltransferase 1